MPVILSLYINSSNSSVQVQNYALPMIQTYNKLEVRHFVPGLNRSRMLVNVINPQGMFIVDKILNDSYFPTYRSFN